MGDEKKPDESEPEIDILNLGEPEFVGKIPPRQDLPIEPKSHVSHCKAPERKDVTVLGPDVPKPRVFGFTVQEVQGYPVVRVPEDLQGREYKVNMFTEEEELRLAALIKDAYEHKLTSFDDLKVGDLVLALGMTGWNVVKIDELRPEQKNGSGLTPGGGTLYMLQFDNDERHCWACIGSGNLIGLKRLQLR